MAFAVSEHSSAFVHLELSTHLVEIGAWDQASCLDIQIIDLATEKCTFPTVGDCKDKGEFERHLDSFMEWFDNLK